MTHGGTRIDRHWTVADRGRAGAVVVVRFLVGRTAVDQLNRMFRLLWLVALAGLVVVVTGPRRVGVALLAVSLLLAGVRPLLVRAIERIALAREYREVRDELAGAVEAGKANMRRELERIGLPSSRWRMPLFVVRLARRSGRDEAKARLEHVNLDHVLPRTQTERAMRILTDVWRRSESTG